ncbi:MAG: hypothetical protein Q8L98_00730 [Chlamydiales bacterium]|nr:hypothetical protein [Chlamydiales bacterium]
MIQPFLDLVGSDPVFGYCALLGTSLFAIQLILNFLIGDVEGDGVLQFKWLSKQALTGFLMMFGWIGLTCKKEFQVSMPVTILFAVLGGMVAVFLIGYLFALAKKLKSEGSVFRLEEAIGKEATVYQRIPKGGSGKITLSLHDLSYEIDAISQLAEEIPSFAQVQIINKVDDKTVLVILK